MTVAARSVHSTVYDDAGGLDPNVRRRRRRRAVCMHVSVRVLAV